MSDRYADEQFMRMLGAVRRANMGDSAVTGLLEGQQAAEQRQILLRERAREDRQRKRRDALRRYYEGRLSAPGPMGADGVGPPEPPMADPRSRMSSSREAAFARLGMLDPEAAAQAEAGVARNMPASMREHLYFESLSPEQKRSYLLTRRGQDVVDFGGGARGYLDPLGGPGAQVDAERFAQAEAGLQRLRQYGESQGATDAKFREYMDTQFPEALQQQQRLQQLLAAYESGQYDQTTGMFQGRGSPYLTEQGARQYWRGIMGTLEALQITNLAPVTEAELELVGRLAEDPKVGVAANIGRIREMLAKVSRGLALARERDIYFNRNGTLEGFGTQADRRRYEGGPTGAAPSPGAADVPELTPEERRALGMED